MDSFNNQNILNKNISSNMKNMQTKKLSMTLNVEKLNAKLGKDGDELKNYITREAPGQIIYLLSILNDTLSDPRRRYGHFVHEYIPIMIIFFLEVLCSYDTVKSIHTFGKDLWSTIMSILDISEEYPHYHTFRRVLNASIPEQMAEARKRWLDLIGINNEKFNNLSENNANLLRQNNENWPDKMKEDLQKLINDQYQHQLLLQLRMERC